jgi:hypothetical protein
MAGEWRDASFVSPALAWLLALALSLALAGLLALALFLPSLFFEGVKGFEGLLGEAAAPPPAMAGEWRSASLASFAFACLPALSLTLGLGLTLAFVCFLALAGSLALAFFASETFGGFTAAAAAAVVNFSFVSLLAALAPAAALSLGEFSPSRTTRDSPVKTQSESSSEEPSSSSSGSERGGEGASFLILLESFR